MRAPVDATATEAWKNLTAIASTFQPDLRAAFSADPGRAARYTVRAGDLYADLSKNLIDSSIADSLVELAREVGIEEARDSMFRGDHINVTEDRAVLHTALRAEAPLEVDGQDVTADVREVLERMYSFADEVRSGRWVGVTGKAITTVINVGIGGSDLGPVMAYEALKPFASLECRFISNVDPSDLGEKLRGVDPETVLFIIASKTFTTLETLTNARACRAWFLSALGERGIEAADAVSKHFVAVSTNLEKVAEFGIDPVNAFGFWSWVGGRYSVDSAVGLSLVLALGPERFEEFLQGFRTMDTHFRTAPLASNLPVLMGLLNVWYSNFLGAATHAILPYSQYLHRFPAYLQQLTMESNGKRVRWDGTDVTSDTGEVFWGEVGTNGQHAFFQLIHQGTRMIPADFIAFAQPVFPIVGDDGADQHELLLGNFLAQTKALAFGRTLEEVLEQGTPESIATARVFPGNKPTTSIMAPALTPSVLGQLIALYEHITFVQGIVWGIDSFDQWGVELGKEMAKDLGPAITGDPAAYAAQDGSTAGLIDFYRANRTR